MTSEPSTAGSDSRRTTLRENAVAAVKKAAVATKWLVLGAGTAILALVGVIASALVAAFCLVGIGVFLLAPMLSAVRWIADLERRRLTAIGSPVPQPYSRNPTEWREAWQFLRSDPAPRRDIAWLCIHATFGLVVGLLPLELLSNAVEELTAPLWWHLAPPGGATMLGGLLPIDSSADARWAIVTGICWAILWFVLPPSLLRAQVAPGNRWLPPHPDVDLSARVTELTATRAAALDAHAVELRRIERALHDGAQNRLVTVAVLTGAARQALARDPATADPLLERVQQSAELASQNYARWCGAFCRRSWSPRDCRVRCRRWPRNAPWRPGWTHMSLPDAPWPSRRWPTTPWPRRSRTSPATAVLSGPMCRCSGRTTHSWSR